jgi:hypothetical protein
MTTADNSSTVPPASFLAAPSRALFEDDDNADEDQLQSAITLWVQVRWKDPQGQSQQ